MDLDDNQITSLQDVQFPTTLEQLDLHGNQIASLRGIQFPNSLVSLVLRGNQITSLKEVQFPIALQELDLSFNRITEFKSKRIVFPNTLHFLDLRGNFITRLERVIFPSSLKILLLNKKGWDITTLENTVLSDGLLQSLTINPDTLKKYTCVQSLDDTRTVMNTFKDFDYISMDIANGPPPVQWRGNTMGNQPGVVRYTSGDIYEGEIKDGTITGWGTFYYINGDIYRGNLDNGRWYGQGTLIIRIEDGTKERYNGEFNGNQVTNGTVTRSDGSIEAFSQTVVPDPLPGLPGDGNEEEVNGGSRSKTKRKQKRKSKRYNIKIKHKSKYSRRRRRTTNSQNFKFRDSIRRK